MFEVLYLSRMINTSRYKYVSLKVSQYPTRKMKKYKYSHFEMLIFLKIKPTVQISYNQMTATTSELMSMSLITVVANTNQTVPCIFILKPSMKSIFSQLQYFYLSKRCWFFFSMCECYSCTRDHTMLTLYLRITVFDFISSTTSIKLECFQ